MESRQRILLEVPVESLEEAVAAVDAGADRLELCAALDVGGLTPSMETLRQFRDRGPAPFAVMIRPRAGNFRYDLREADAMEASVLVAIRHGAAAIVFGGLNESASIDEPLCRRLIAAARHAETVLHRAFDQLNDPPRVLDQLIELGINRVLTSGGATCAAEPDGIERITGLIRHAAGRIEILPGGGIRPYNVTVLVQATGCTSVHSSCRRYGPDGSVFDPALVAEMRAILDRLP